MPPHRPAADASANGVRWLRPACAAALIGALLLAYAGALRSPFHFDDFPSIVENPTIRELGSLQWVVPPATAGETVSGRPVLNLSFALNHALGGLDVLGYHLTNLAIHAATALLLAGIVGRTLRVPFPRHGPAQAASGPSPTLLAFVLAAIWALHPLQTAAVTYVVQRAESLAAFFILLALYGFVRAVADPQAGGAAKRGRAGERPRPRSSSDRRALVWTSLSVAACFLGAGTKETAATAPLLILLYDRQFVSGSLAAALRSRRGYYAALAASWVLLALLVLTNHARGGSAGWGTGITPLTYFFTQLQAVAHYLTLAFWPASQVFDYGTITVDRLPAVWVELVLLLCLFGASAWATLRRAPLGFCGAALFLLLAPSSSVVPVATQTMAEHRMYLPLAALLCGCGMIVAYGAKGIVPAPISRLPANAALTCAGVPLVIALSFATAARNQVYASELLLWGDTVSKRPENARAHHNLALALNAAGEGDRAAAEFTRAIELQPTHAYAHAGLASVLLVQGRLEEAVAHYRAAVAADPTLVAARLNLGHALGLLGRNREAAAEYEAALRLEPGAPEALNNMAAIHLAEGRIDEAIRLLHDVLARHEHLAESHFQLAVALERRAGPGDLVQAQRSAQEALRLRPIYPQAHLALGRIHVAGGDPGAAETALRAALAQAPRLAEAQFALGNLLARERRIDEAAAAYLAVLAIEPRHVQARANLGNCQLVTGHFSEAIATYEQVLGERPQDASVQKNLELARELLRQRGDAP